MAGAIVSVVIRNITTEMQKSPSMHRVSEKPQVMPVESISLASGS